MRRAGRSAFIAGGLVLLLVGVAPAQSRTTGSSSGGGFTGGSNSSGGGFTGGSNSNSPGGGGNSAGNSGNSGGGFTGSAGGAGGPGSNSNTNTIGATSPLGRYYGNPLTNRLSPASSTSGKFVITPSVYPNSYATGFGSPVFNSASLTTSPTRGSTGIGTQGTGGTTFAGATSAGIRRAPGYITEPVFDMPPRPSLDAIQPELQSVVSRATRLPSRDRIQVVTDGDTVVLRGQVRDERERRLAEAMIRLSPGVRLVRNELDPLNKTPK